MVHRKVLGREGQSDYDGYRRMSRFKLASALTFTVICSKNFQIWRFFLRASAGHCKRFGRTLYAHPCCKVINKLFK